MAAPVTAGPPDLPGRAPVNNGADAAMTPPADPSLRASEERPWGALPVGGRRKPGVLRLLWEVEHEPPMGWGE